jgi:uncharacterized protein
MDTKDIGYFVAPGEQNTAGVIKAVKERISESGIKNIVVASNSGATALALWNEIHDLGVKIISVTEHAGFNGGDRIQISPEVKKELEDKGVCVLMGSHALSGVGRSISKKFGGTSPTEIIAAALRLFGGEGLKVAVEVSVMAADAGLVPTDAEMIAVGGTWRGADSAIVLKPAHMNNFFDLEIREIICKPRQRK